MKHQIEKRTRGEVVTTYFFIVLLSAALLYLIYTLKDSVDNQRVNLDHHHNIMALGADLSQNIQKAQSFANMYAFTDGEHYYNEYKELCHLIRKQTDSLSTLLIDTSYHSMLSELNILLAEKGDMSLAISEYFTLFDPLEEIDKALAGYTPAPPSPIYIKVIQHDSTASLRPRRSFWERLSDVFRPSSTPDSIVNYTKQQTDTIATASQDSINIIDDIKNLSGKAKNEYRKKIKSFEKQANQLIEADSKISEQISEVLLIINHNMFQDTIAEIERSEDVINKNIRISFITSAVLLLLIITFIILIITDINKGYRARRAAEEAHKKTQELMESRHKLLLSISHDIKTPLSSIIGNLDLLEHTKSSQVMSMKQSANTILQLLQELLEFSSLEQGKLKPYNTQFDIHKLCHDTFTMFAPIAQNKKLSLQFSCNIEQGTIIFSDEVKIKQIIHNLLSNAIKYTVEGSVSFEADIHNDILYIKIEDTGVGIPDDKKEDIFKPFVRIETYNTLAEGSGYGMSVVKGLVELLDGSITLSSEEGKGSSFEVSLPLNIKPQEAIEHISLRGLESKGKLKIMLIDDDPTLLAVIEKMITRLGHQAICCNSKSEFESNINEVDLIITDREMGAMTGNQVLAEAKAHDAMLAVVLMTARTEYDNEQAKKEGFDGLLSKPFGIKELATLLGHDSIEENDIKANISDDFPRLSELLANDGEAINNVLTIFVSNTSDNLLSLNECIETSDFEDAQKLCHKMLPMFTELQQEKMTPFLSKMDALRGHNELEYQEWKDDAIAFMAQADELLTLLSEKYGID